MYGLLPSELPLKDNFWMYFQTDKYLTIILLELIQKDRS